ALAALVALELAWGEHKTPLLFRGEPTARVHARDAASGWLAATGRPDDVLFGYDPLYLGAWERDRVSSQPVVPRADPKLALAARGPLLLLDELAEARRVLERRETDGTGCAAAAQAVPARGRERRGGAEEPAEHERPEPGAPVVAVHGGIVGSAACGSARSATP